MCQCVTECVLRRYECSLRNKDTIGLLDLARSEYDRVIKDDFLGVLADYLRQAGA